MLNGKKSYNFTDRTHSREGKLATALGCVVVVIFLFLIIQSIRFQGRLDPIYGMIGMVDVIIAITGLIIGCMSFKEENILPLFPKIGVLLNGIMILVYLVLFIIGL